VPILIGFPILGHIDQVFASENVIVPKYQAIAECSVKEGIVTGEQDWVMVENQSAYDITIHTGAAVAFLLNPEQLQLSNL